MTDPKAPLAGCARAFGRHRTYPPRQGWLLKTHNALTQDPGTFRRDDAPVVLGVGSSMVPAMRFWAYAFGLIHHLDDGTSSPTSRGHWLLDEDQGADPYLEDPRSLWLLHWWLLGDIRPCQVPTWYYLFAEFWRTRTTRAELRQHVRAAAEHTYGTAPADDTITRDIACLVAMYAPTIGSEDQPRAGLEDVLANPFRDLHLIEAGEPSAVYRGDRSQELRIHRWAGRSAPADIVAYACLSYAARACGPGPGSISIARLAKGPASPGRVLLTKQTHLRGTLERAAGRHPQLAVAQSALGEDLLAYSGPPQALAEQILADAYRRPGGPDGRR